MRTGVTSDTCGDGHFVTETSDSTTVGKDVVTLLRHRVGLFERERKRVTKEVECDGTRRRLVGCEWGYAMVKVQIPFPPGRF